MASRIQKPAGLYILGLRAYLVAAWKTKALSAAAVRRRAIVQSSARSLLHCAARTGFAKATTQLFSLQTRDMSLKVLQSMPRSGSGMAGRREKERMSRTRTCGRCFWAMLRGWTAREPRFTSGESRESGMRTLMLLPSRLLLLKPQQSGRIARYNLVNAVRFILPSGVVPKVSRNSLNAPEVAYIGEC